MSPGTAGRAIAAPRVVIAAVVWALAGAATLGGGAVPDFGTAPRAQAAVVGPIPLAPGWARVIMAGTLVSAAPSGGVVSVSIGGPSKADVFQGGTSWRTRPLSGTRLVHLLPQTMTVDSTARPIAPETFRAGDRVAVWGVMSPQDEIMALSMMAATAHPATGPAQAGTPDAGGVTGVVAARSGAMLDLVTDAGTRRAVVLTAATQVRADGYGAAPAIAPFDVVQIDGAVNSDGSLVAARVTVGFLASQGAQISGPIETVQADLGGLVVGGTMVCTSARTYFVRGGSRLRIAQMAVGRPVTAYGLPIVAGKTPVGLAARVVAVR